MGKIVALGEVVSDIYRGEELSEVELGFVARPGGAPANVAVAASRLGSEAAFVGSVGEDLFGDFILRALESEGVETGGVSRQKPPTRTSLAFVEIGEDGDREFTFYRSSPAADELLAPEDVTEDTVSGASFVNFGSIPLIREPVRSATRRIADLAKANGVPVAFDVNFREHLWENREAAREAVDPLLDLSTIVKMGDDELSPLLGVEDVEEAARTLLDRGVPLVLISKGPEGAYYATKEFSGEVPSFDIDEVVDATGAGDAFLAAALVHLSGEPFEEERVREAALRGCAAGALACTGYGAMSALPTKDELERFMSAAKAERPQVASTRDSVREGHAVFNYCVYTMRHTDQLQGVLDNLNGSATFEEHKRWVEGERLFRESQRQNERMPVLFAPAEKEGGVLFYAWLDAVDVNDDTSTTTYRFSNLTRLDKERPKSSLIKKSDHKPLSDNYIRPYAICVTPNL